MIDDSDQPNPEVFDRARLMIRVAMWISTMDASGGQESLRAERRSIVETLQDFRKERDYAPLRHIIDVALEHHKAWDSWSKDLSDLTRGLRAASPTMPLHLRQCLYDLAYCVATRYRERNWLTALLSSLRVSFSNFVAPAEGRIDLPSYLNVSPSEKSALNELAEILSLNKRLIR